MIAHITAHITEIKMTLAALLGATAWLADASDDLSIAGWEEASLKGILLFAVFYIGRLFLQAQKDHKAEMTLVWQSHKEESTKREERMCAALDKHSVSLERIADLNEEQLLHFRSFVKGAVDAQMRTLPPK
jgi:hypothetical protein